MAIFDGLSDEQRDRAVRWLVDNKPSRGILANRRWAQAVAALLPKSRAETLWAIYSGAADVAFSTVCALQDVSPVAIDDGILEAVVARALADPGASDLVYICARFLAAFLDRTPVQGAVNELLRDPLIAGIIGGGTDRD